MPKRALASSAIALAVLLAACGADAGPTPVPAPTATPAASPSPTAIAEATPALPAPTPDARSGLADLTDVSWAFLQRLTRELSPRESATDEERVAAEFLVSELEALGLAPYLQPFTVEVLDRNVPVLAIDGDERLDLGGVPLRLSAEVRASGALVDAGLAAPADVDPDRVRGKVALIERGTLTFQAKVRRVQEAGAVAAVVYNDRPGAFAGRLSTEPEIPAIGISRESGEALKALMAGREVVATVSTVLETADSRNIVVKMPGAASGEAST